MNTNRSIRKKMRSAEVEFKRSSRLLIMKACGPGAYDRPGTYDPDAPGFAYYFLWQGNKWSLLRRVPLEQNER
jgi:hypothetical protein